MRTTSTCPSHSTGRRLSPVLFLMTALLVLAVVLAAAPGGAAAPVGQAAGAGPAGGPPPVTFYATGDTFVDGNSPTENFDSKNYLSVGRASAHDRHALVRFNLSSIPAGSTYLGATLQLYTEINLAGMASAGPDAIGQIWAHRVVSGLQGLWIENSVNWQSQPLYYAPADDPATTVNYSNGWKSFDVSDAVGEWVENGAANNGFLLRGDHSTTWVTYFNSTEYGGGSSGPRLLVYFEPPTPTATPTSTRTPQPSRTPTPRPKLLYLPVVARE